MAKKEFTTGSRVIGKNKSRHGVLGTVESKVETSSGKVRWSVRWDDGVLDAEVTSRGIDLYPVINVRPGVNRRVVGGVDSVNPIINPGANEVPSGFRVTDLLLDDLQLLRWLDPADLGKSRADCDAFRVQFTLGVCSAYENTTRAPPLPGSAAVSGPSQASTPPDPSPGSAVVSDPSLSMSDGNQCNIDEEAKGDGDDHGDQEEVPQQDVEEECIIDGDGDVLRVKYGPKNKKQEQEWKRMRVVIDEAIGYLGKSQTYGPDGEPSKGANLHWLDGLPGHDRKKMEFFLLMFPAEILKVMVKSMNDRFKRKNSKKKLTSKSELLKLFGIVFYMALHPQNGRKATYWRQPNKEHDPADKARSFHYLTKKTGISKDRFADLWPNLSVTPFKTQEEHEEVC